MSRWGTAYRTKQRDCSIIYFTIHSLNDSLGVTHFALVVIILQMGEKS